MPGKGDNGQDRCYDAKKTGNCHGNKNVFHLAKMSRQPTKLRYSTVGVFKNQGLREGFKLNGGGQHAFRLTEVEEEWWSDKYDFSS